MTDDDAFTRWLMYDVGHVLDVIPPPPAWQIDAACIGVDPDVFFPPKGRPGLEALAICRSCPVAEQCLAFVMELEESDGERTGVWAGTSARERMRLARQQAA